jgi:hypothetical protein
MYYGGFNVGLYRLPYHIAGSLLKMAIDLDNRRYLVGLSCHSTPNKEVQRMRRQI